MRIVPRHIRLEQRAADLEYVISIIDTPTDVPQAKRAGKQIGFRSGEGDQKRMRAIPVIAEGVPGTIPLTEGYAYCRDLEIQAERRMLSDA